MECNLRIRNGKDSPGARIGNDNRSRFSLHQVGDERLKISRRTQVLRTGKGNQEECQTLTQLAELKSIGYALHRHSTWHIKMRMSNGQNSGPRLTMLLSFKF